MQKPYRSKKNLALLVVGLIVLFGYLFFSSTPSPPPPEDSKVVEVVQARIQDIQQTVEFIGTIKAEKETWLIAKARGVLNRYAASGQMANAGDILAKIENKDIEQNYKLAQDMENIAKLQYERLSKLHTSGASSKNAVEEKESQWIEAQRKLSDARIALDDIIIRAPFDGITGIYKVRQGSQVQEGDVLMNYYDPSTVIVEFNVPLSIASLVQDGSPVFVHHQPYALTHIQKMLDEETHMSPAYVHIQCDDCIIGATTSVVLVVQQKKSVIVIPYESVFLRDGKPYVYVVKDKKAVLTPVGLGLKEKEITEITSGLKNGDHVIVRGQARLYPGIPVRESPKP